MRPLIRDRFNNTDQQAAASASMRVITALQDLPPEQQVVGICAAFRVLAEVSEVPAQDLFAVTGNVMTDAEGRYIPEFRAVKEYVENEL